MRINTRLQYGFLLSVYICRGGRVTIEEAAANLRLSPQYLEQVARKLRLGGIIKSIRGPGGGYEFVGDPTVRQVFEALGSVSFLKQSEQLAYQKGAPEHRTFSSYVRNLSAGINPLLNRTVRNVAAELVANEMATLNRAVITAQAN